MRAPTAQQIAEYERVKERLADIADNISRRAYEVALEEVKAAGLADGEAIFAISRGLLRCVAIMVGSGAPDMNTVEASAQTLSELLRVYIMSTGARKHSTTPPSAWTD